MAAMLTKITLTPYDAQHLPIQTLKFIKKDTAFEFDLEAAKDAQILNGEIVTKVDDLGGQTQKEKETQTPTEKAAKTNTLHACGREPGEDPYFMHLYRVRFDGSNLKLLDPGDAMHATAMDAAGKHFVDNVSTINSSAMPHQPGHHRTEPRKAPDRRQSAQTIKRARTA